MRDPIKSILVPLLFLFCSGAAFSQPKQLITNNSFAIDGSIPVYDQVTKDAHQRVTKIETFEDPSGKKLHEIIFEYNADDIVPFNITTKDPRTGGELTTVPKPLGQDLFAGMYEYRGKVPCEISYEIYFDPKMTSSITYTTHPEEGRTKDFAYDLSGKKLSYLSSFRSPSDGSKIDAEYYYSDGSIMVSASYQLGEDAKDAMGGNKYLRKLTVYDPSTESVYDELGEKDHHRLGDKVLIADHGGDELMYMKGGSWVRVTNASNDHPGLFQRPVVDIYSDVLWELRKELPKPIIELVKTKVNALYTPTDNKVKDEELTLKSLPVKNKDDKIIGIETRDNKILVSGIRFLFNEKGDQITGFKVIQDGNIHTVSPSGKLGFTHSYLYRDAWEIGYKLYFTETLPNTLKPNSVVTYSSRDKMTVKTFVFDMQGNKYYDSELVKGIGGTRTYYNAKNGERLLSVSYDTETNETDKGYEDKPYTIKKVDIYDGVGKDVLFHYDSKDGFKYTARDGSKNFITVQKEENIRITKAYTAMDRFDLMTLFEPLKQYILEGPVNKNVNTDHEWTKDELDKKTQEYATKDLFDDVDIKDLLPKKGGLINAMIDLADQGPYNEYYDKAYALLRKLQNTSGIKVEDKDKVQDLLVRLNGKSNIQIARNLPNKRYKLENLYNVTLIYLENYPDFDAEKFERETFKGMSPTFNQVRDALSKLTQYVAEEAVATYKNGYSPETVRLLINYGLLYFLEDDFDRTKDVPKGIGLGLLNASLFSGDNLNEILSLKEFPDDLFDLLFTNREIEIKVKDCMETYRNDEKIREEYRDKIPRWEVKL